MINAVVICIFVSIAHFMIRMFLASAGNLQFLMRREIRIEKTSANMHSECCRLISERI